MIDDPTGYDGLPDPVRLIYSRMEWHWLTDEQRARAVQDACEPDTNYDD